MPDRKEMREKLMKTVSEYVEETVTPQYLPKAKKLISLVAEGKATPEEIRKA